MRLRDLQKMNSINDGTRTLTESIAVPEVLQALRDWEAASGSTGILIGGCAASFYARPRATMDVDFLFMSSEEIPDRVPGFKRTRSMAFQHDRTHVEVEVIAPTSIGVDPALIKKVIETARTVGDLKVASPTGLVALKLQRMRRYDAGDIEALIETGQIDLTGWPITPAQQQQFKKIEAECNV